ncbi:hypothetical protein [Streptomyces sp. 891-h]|uniref:hypothetical protein n=1 Tax=Streptomyces sp. 891-h TaxID=2720714 RepID=UPI001FAB1E29|nr:hypothetical protein [Streptomyces sp. 891-h]UNZ21347.1 hypothetical protein HC362_34150 [Streptomyces sp. 891-h]
MRTRLTAASVVMGFAAPLLAAAPAEADSSGCTHHLSGPQVCIRLTGRNGANSVTGFWANPPKRIKKRAISLSINGKHYDTATGRRKGRTISHTWYLNLGTGKTLCVKVKGSKRIACQKTTWVGDRAS